MSGDHCDCSVSWYWWNGWPSLRCDFAGIPLRRCVLVTTLYDKVCQWLAARRWFSHVTPISSTNKTDRHDITEIFLKVALNTIALTLTPNSSVFKLSFQDIKIPMYMGKTKLYQGLSIRYTDMLFYQFNSF
jgi:hypothetical protein